MKKKFPLLLLFSLILFTTGYTATSPSIEKKIFFYGDSIYSGKPLIIIPGKVKWGNVKKMKLKDKISLKILQKALKKNLGRYAAEEPKESKTIGILSVVTGGIGLILLFAGTPIFLIFSLAGIILGIIGLKNQKKTLALIGIILGGVTILLLLIALLAFSLYW